MRERFFLFLIPFVFFVISFISLRDYGISSDEPEHFARGQGYLYFFLTGEKNYPSDLGPRRSYYQIDLLNAEYYLKNDSGHPPLNGILASLTNWIFYQKLGILGDIESLHLFNILASTLLVFIVTLFAYQVIGIWGAGVTGIVLSTYPLFFSEAHFNIKDPPQAAFFATTIWTFWYSLKKGNWKWLVLAVVSFAFALGTKFNILFLPFILFPYLLLRYFGILSGGVKKILFSFKKIPKPYLLTLLISPLIVILIFFASWPFLWSSPLENLSEIFGFYRHIGVRSSNQLGYFLPSGVNLFAIIWIIITTPLPVLFLVALGLFFVFRRLSKEKTELLWLFWLLVPVARVTIPKTAIYGGVRHIMEFVPAMALIAGLGASYLFLFVKKAGLRICLIFVILIFLAYPIIKYHPNQNVYFNELVGGLWGARQKDVPYYGYSLGNAYLQAINWLNANAESDARLALIQSTGLVIPLIQLRSDIKYSNGYWSAIERKGEYLMEVTYNDKDKPYPYAWEYVENFLEPVYEVKVDGVPIAKIWKNDFSHTKGSMAKVEDSYQRNLKTSKEGRALVTQIGQKVFLSRYILEFSQNTPCDSFAARILTSLDGKVWREEKETIPATYYQGTLPAISGNRLVYFFAGREASFIKLAVDSYDSCFLMGPKIQLVVLK